MGQKLETVKKKVIEEIESIREEDSYIIIIAKPNPVMVVDDLERGERLVMEGGMIVSTHKINSLEMAKVCLALLSFPDVDNALKFLLSNVASFGISGKIEDGGSEDDEVGI